MQFTYLTAENLGISCQSLTMRSENLRLFRCQQMAAWTIGLQVDFDHCKFKVIITYF
jgi:hypothetical protein